MLKKIFARILKGLISFIPIIITLVVFNYLFSLFESFFNLIFGYSKGNIFITIFAFISLGAILYYIGFLLEKNREVILLRVTETIINKIPVLKSIYSVIKDMVNLFSAKKDSYKGVVYIPVGKGKIMGFITRVDKNILTVFIPTTPNPTTGLLLFVDKDDVEYIDITVEDAVKKLVSLGATK